jgi:hypothetical protein
MDGLSFTPALLENSPEVLTPVFCYPVYRPAAPEYEHIDENYDSTDYDASDKRCSSHVKALSSEKFSRKHCKIVCFSEIVKMRRAFNWD